MSKKISDVHTLEGKHFPTVHHWKALIHNHVPEKHVTYHEHTNHVPSYGEVKMTRAMLHHPSMHEPMHLGTYDHDLKKGNIRTGLGIHIKEGFQMSLVQHAINQDAVSFKRALQERIEALVSFELEESKIDIASVLMEDDKPSPDEMRRKMKNKRAERWEKKKQRDKHDESVEVSDEDVIDEAKSEEDVPSKPGKGAREERRAQKEKYDKKRRDESVETTDEVVEESEPVNEISYNTLKKYLPIAKKRHKLAVAQHKWNELYGTDRQTAIHKHLRDKHAKGIATAIAKMK